MEELSVSWSTLEVARDPPISCFYSHILLLLLSPTRHIIPLFNTSKPFRILLHVYDIFLHGLATRTSPPGKYLAPRTRAHKESGFNKNLQLCFANIAKLNVCISLILILHSLLAQLISPIVSNVSFSHFPNCSTNTCRLVC